MKKILPAAYRGEIATLFVARDRHLWGVVDPAANTVTLHEQPQPGDEDLVNVAAIHTLRHGHTVYALRPEEMPAGHSLAGVEHVPPPKQGKRP